MSASICFRIEAPAHEVERLIAELHSLGTLGIEERSADPYTLLLAYFSVGSVPESAVLGLADAARRIQLRGRQSVPAMDWEREWRAGLGPRRVGSLWIRPSWCASQGTRELEIDPEQAFGSGEHASTRLALTLLLDALQPGERVLDVGTGSGILGLGALRMGAGFALGLDLDPQACTNAAANRSRNGLPLALACGTLAALAPQARFDLVVANMLPRQLQPWIGELVRRASRGLVLSGYLREEREELRALLSARGSVAVREIEEPQSGDTWCASLWLQARALQSASRSPSVSSKR